MKYLLTSIIILTSLFGRINAQFLHYGAQIFASPQLDMEFFQYEKNEYVFYFANQQNETIRFDGLDTSRIRSMNPYPAIYARLDLNIRWFVQLDAFYFWFRNEASYKNSVDFSEYTNTFNSENSQQIFNYNSLQLKWRFWGNRLILGYMMNKKRALRPFIFTGYTTMYKSSCRIGDEYDARIYRNWIIYNHLNTFKFFTMYNTSGFGFKYQGLSVAAYFFRSLGNIDEYAKDYKMNETLSIDEPHPNYKFIEGAFISISYNLFSKNISNSKLFNKKS